MSTTTAAADFTYAPAPESTAIVALRDAYGLFIGGTWQASADAKTFVTENPATQERLADVAQGGEADVDRAVRAARRGFEKYLRKQRPRARAK